jgi:hypothetical protein
MEAKATDDCEPASPASAANINREPRMQREAERLSSLNRDAKRFAICASMRIFVGPACCKRRKTHGKAGRPHSDDQHQRQLARLTLFGYPDGLTRTRPSGAFYLAYRAN